MCLVSNERRETALDNEAYRLMMRGNEEIPLIKRVSFLLGHTVFAVSDKRGGLSDLTRDNKR